MMVTCRKVKLLVREGTLCNNIRGKKWNKKKPRKIYTYTFRRWLRGRRDGARRGFAVTKKTLLKIYLKKKLNKEIVPRIHRIPAISRFIFLGGNLQLQRFTKLMIFPGSGGGGGNDFFLVLLTFPSCF